MLEVARRCKQLVFENNIYQDAFARSAFNRFYYTCFLRTREMCRQLTKITRIKHKEVPNYLRTTIRGTIKTRSDTLMRRSGNSRVKTSYAQLRQSGMTASNELAQLLEEAYRVRVLADYEPEIQLIVQQQPLSIALDGTTLEGAERWVVRANTSIGQIQRAWNQLA